MQPAAAAADGAAKPMANGDDPEMPGQDSDSDEDGDDAAAEHVATGTESAAKPKKKKKKSKKKKKAVPTVQTDPPSVLISKLFPNKTYPKGVEVEYMDENRYRTTSEEKRHLDNLNPDFLDDYRHAAEAHRQVRQWAQRTIKPGQTLLDIANSIEDAARRLVGHDGLSQGDALLAGMGFPTGLNIDNVVAHYSPNAGCKVVLNQDSVLKVDIGYVVHGYLLETHLLIFPYGQRACWWPHR